MFSSNKILFVLTVFASFAFADMSAKTQEDNDPNREEPRDYINNKLNIYGSGGVGGMSVPPITGVKPNPIVVFVRTLIAPTVIGIGPGETDQHGRVNQTGKVIVPGDKTTHSK